MGQSTNGILAYGYDLGGDEGGWKVREAGEYGDLTLPWLPEPEDFDDYDLATLLERRLLDASGFTETYEDVCPFGNDCGWTPEYPKGYRDPPWERTGIPSVDEERFGKIVLPARAAAITKALNAHLAAHGFGDLRFEWQSA